MTNSEEINFILSEYFNSFGNKDWEKFSSFITEDFTYFSDNMTVMNKNAFIEFLNKDTWQGNGFELSSMETHVSGNGDLGFAVYKISFKGLMNGKESEVKAAETMLFKKENNNWKICHSHVSNKY